MSKKHRHDQQQKPALSNYVEGATPIPKTDPILPCVAAAETLEERAEREEVTTNRELSELRILRLEVEKLLSSTPEAISVYDVENGPLNVAASLEATFGRMKERMLPREITPAIAEVLCFDPVDAVKIARRFRDVGATIEEKFEVEHAFVLFWLLGFALEHGNDWKAKAAQDLPPKKDKR